MERVSSLQNALRMLNLFTMDEPELNVSELADKLGVALSTAYRLANTATEEGFLRKDPITKRYTPSTSILFMGNIVLSYLDVYRLSSPYLESLVKKTGETAHICILNDDHVIYLNKVDGEYPASLLSHMGRRNPVHCTSSGQVMLAYQSPDVIERLITKGLEPYTDQTVTSPERFRQLLQQVKKQGYAVGLEELHEGVNSIAAPVSDASGNVIACVSMAGPVQRFNQHTLPKLVQMVVHYANEITTCLKKE